MNGAGGGDPVRHRKSGQTPHCADRRSHRAPVRVTEAMRRWWLDRYTLDEVRELAAGLRI